MAATVFAADNVTGKWSGNMRVSAGGQDQEVALVVILQQAGSELNGTITPAGKETVSIQNGRVDGDKVSFEIVGANPSLKFDGALSDRNLKLNVEGSVVVADEEHRFKGTVNLKREQ